MLGYLGKQKYDNDRNVRLYKTYKNTGNSSKCWPIEYKHSKEKKKENAAKAAFSFFNKHIN